ncbi:hypothetical protein HPB50_009002 [Hyalomma asiaticum]|uniref:Uncharacterized protein n=1 Tax=Hyalomma asiaticum TaxID=266040 RepID=A0ACB7SBG4_HYAAI|nr:hypothetical protein HPB50_009002 [Hyalomma asiaticum]
MSVATVRSENIEQGKQKTEGYEGNADDLPPTSTVFGVPTRRLQSAATVVLIVVLAVACFFYFKPRHTGSRKVVVRTECSAQGCRQLGVFLESTVNRSVDPCRDFFSFTCAAPLKKERMSQMNDDVRTEVIAMIAAAHVPSRSQSAFEKAAATYRACVSLYSTNRSEAEDLLAFLSRLGLHITASQSNRDPLDAIVQLNLAWNLPVIVAINEAAGSRLDYPHEAKHWKAMVQLHSNQTYRMDDQLVLEALVSRLTVFLLTELERADVVRLISWSALRQLAPYADGRAHGGTLTDIRDLCYDEMADVLEAALTSKYIYKRVTHDMVREATYMGFRLRQSIKHTVGESTWLSRDSRNVARRKVDAMRLIIAFPFNLTHLSALERLYSDMPDVALTDNSGGETDARGSGRSFVLSWLNASRFQRRVAVRRPTEIFFSLGTVNAQHTYSTNTVNLAAALLEPVIYYDGAPPAYNYGGLGQLMGHEMMHGFDVTGRLFDEEGTKRDWWTDEATEKYAEQTACLRSMHREALKRRALALDPMDSEDLADVMGVRVAFNAQRNLAVAFDKIASGRVAGFSELQLFFLGHCAKMCDPKVPPRERDKTKAYAPNWARCVVPLMNMREFADAFQCANGTFMNPEHKCHFWQ